MPEFTDADLEDIQGTILSAFSHLRYGSYLFLQLKDTAKAKVWLSKVIPQTTTSRRWELPGGRKRKSETTLNIGFTYPGLKTLGLLEDTLLTFSREFILGMPGRAKVIGDTGKSAPESWEVGGPNTEEVHVILVLNAMDEEARDGLREAHRALLSETDGGVVEVNEQHGHRPASDKEPFGFLDGISQPLIERSKGNPEPNEWVIRTGEFILGYLNEYHEYPLSPGVFAKNDPDNILPPLPDNAIPEWKDLGRHGSYMVYRKLAQDVAGFWNYMAAHAKRGSDGLPDVERAAGSLPTGEPPARTMVYLASKCVGRWPSGAPLVLAPDKDDPVLGMDLSRNNNFMYQPTDKAGFACPIGSHVRRSNPRDSRINEEPKESLIAINRHRILRRAVSFGTDLFPRDDVERGKIPLNLKDDGQERGIHFFAINASIRRQFELIQETWCNKGSFNSLFNNKDPIVGNNDGSSHMTIQRRPVRKRLMNLPRFVNVRGGGYFFLPSMTALRFLANSRCESKGGSNVKKAK